jgi:hypothetical protein
MKQTFRVSINGCAKHPFSPCECPEMGQKRLTHILVYLANRYAACRREHQFTRAKQYRAAYDLIEKLRAQGMGRDICGYSVSQWD